MATCPRCKGHLTDNHLCPRSRGRVAVEATIAAIAGAFTGLLIFSMLDPAGKATMDVVWLIGGALAGVGLDKLLRV